MARDGELHTAVVGYDAVGRYRCVVLQSADTEAGYSAGSVEGSEVLLVPGPLQRYADAITHWFGVHQVAWAAFIGEAWLFPQDEEGLAAAAAFASGDGLPPSRHPRRVEAAFVSLMAPPESFVRMEMFGIERRPHRGPRLVPAPELAAPARALPDGGSEVTPEGNVSWMSSWLEECLPHPTRP